MPETLDASFSNRSHDEEYGPLPETLHNFLSNVGVLRTQTASTKSIHNNNNNNNTLVSSLNDNNNNNNNSGSDHHGDLIFESSFDLTEERLKHVFEMFDTDQDGLISYESLKRGLEFHSGGNFLLDETSFQQLVDYLDSDRSGDISYGEFTNGIRILMLQRLVLSPNVDQEVVNVQVMDYNAIRLERSTLKNTKKHDSQSINDKINDSTTTATPASPNASVTVHDEEMFLATKELEFADFYFQDRPSWVKTRWINVSGTSTGAAGTLRRLSIKFNLHPLALEDALSPESHRPKAEVYSSLFSIEPLPIKAPTPRSLSTRGTSFLASLFSSCLGSTRSTSKNNNNNNSKASVLFETSGEMPMNYDSGDGTQELKIGKIRIQMTSIFVNVPTNDTIITYNNNNNNNDNHDDISLLDNFSWLRVQKELGKGYSKLRQYDAQYLTYALLDRAVDLIDPIIRQLRKEISQEKQTLPKTNYQSLERVHQLREQLERVVRKLKPFMRLLVHVIEDDAISPGATVYLRDVLDNLECHDDEVKHLILECQALDDDAEKYQSRKMDQTLYTLTVISAIFLPAQFLTGVWGMNFEHMPELDEKWGYAMFWGIAVFMSMTLLCLLDFGRFRN